MSVKNCHFTHHFPKGGVKHLLTLIFPNKNPKTANKSAFSIKTANKSAFSIKTEISPYLLKNH